MTEHAQPEEHDPAESLSLPQFAAVVGVKPKSMQAMLARAAHGGPEARGSVPPPDARVSATGQARWRASTVRANLIGRGRRGEWTASEPAAALTITQYAALMEVKVTSVRSSFSRAKQRPEREPRYLSATLLDPETDEPLWDAAAVADQVLLEHERALAREEERIPHSGEESYELARERWEKGKPIGMNRWVTTQIQQLRSDEESLPPERRRALRQMGITADTFTRREARLYTQFQRWMSEHPDPPQQSDVMDFPGESKLFAIGAEIKALRARHTRGELGPVAERFEALEGWTWDEGERRWMKTFAELTAHVEATGGLSGLEAKDRRWLSTQRRSMREGTMPEDKQELFVQLPEQRDTVAEFVQAARAWLKAHRGKGMDAVGFRDTVKVGAAEPYPLGRRATYYRRRYAGTESAKSLTKAEIAAIEALPGWKWALQPGRRPGSGTRG